MSQQVKAPCEAVAVRFVADTRNEEFLNVGVVLFCPAHRYARAKFLTSWGRISHAFPTADLVHLRRLKRLFESACDAWVVNTSAPELFKGIDNLSALLRSIVALDDATIGFSKTISGVTGNPEATLADLFRTYVGREDDEGIVEGRDDEAVWHELVKIARPELVKALTRHTLKSSHYEQAFEHSWKHGAWNAAQPLSFDMREPQKIREKALLWVSKIRELRPAENDTMVHFLVGLPSEKRPKEIRAAARDAHEILADAVGRDDARVVPEAKMGELVKTIEDAVKDAAE